MQWNIIEQVLLCFLFFEKYLILTKHIANQKKNTKNLMLYIDFRQTLNVVL